MKIVFTSKDLFGNIFQFFKQSYVTPDNKRFMKNVKNGTWCILLVLPKKGNTLNPDYVANKFLMCSNNQHVGIHETGNANIIFSTKTRLRTDVKTFKKVYNSIFEDFENFSASNN